MQKEESWQRNGVIHLIKIEILKGNTERLFRGVVEWMVWVENDGRWEIPT